MLLCERCGAPIEAEMAGGVAHCRYCGVQNMLQGRDERPVFQPGMSAPLPEPERIQRLRMQDHQPLLPPAGLEQLAPGGKLEPWKVQEAMAVWQQTRQSLRANRSDFPAAERLLFLTQLLSQNLSEQNDVVRQRAMLESALEAATLPRQRQIILGYLCRAACRANDPDAAESWLRPCDARSDDLMMDSSFRFSRAYVDTLRGNFQGVIAALGRGPEEVPIHDSMDIVCDVLRANAWERMGQTQAAIDQLRARMAQGPAMRAGIEAVLRVHASWNLCAQSFPAAQQQQDVVGADQAANAGGGVVGWILIGTGAFVMFMGVVTSVGPLITAMEMTGRYSASFLTGPLVAISTTGLIGVGLVVGGVLFLKSAAKTRRIRLHGLRAQARVVAVNPTGMIVNGVPRMEIVMLVNLPGRPEYQASTKVILRGVERLVGQTIAARVDPENQNEVIAELS